MSLERRGLSALPQEISPDGREIWSWAAALGAEVQRVSKMRELSASIRELRTQCSSCSLWMTRQCPRERNVNGRKTGPSMKAPICGEFRMRPDKEALIEQRSSELATLTERPTHVPG
jgi:hypothetical protein